LTWKTIIFNSRKNSYNQTVKNVKAIFLEICFMIFTDIFEESRWTDHGFFNYYKCKNIIKWPLRFESISLAYSKIQVAVKHILNIQ
jgi:hypothetical protein